MSKTARTLAAAGFILASALPAFAQKPQEPSPEHVQALIAQAKQQTPQQPATPSPSAARDAGRPDGESHRAGSGGRARREKNLTLISERITPQTWDFTMAATRAIYRPNLTSAVSNNSQVRLTTDVFSGGSRVTTRHQSWSAGMTQNSVGRRRQLHPPVDQQPAVHRLRELDLQPLLQLRAAGALHRSRCCGTSRSTTTGLRS